MPSRLTVVLVFLLLGTSAVIFWLWLVIVPARVSETCPKECHCDNGSFYIPCTAPYLTSLPLIRMTGIRKLGLFHCNITLLEKESFVSRGLTQLDGFFVFRLGLRTIEVGAFNGLTALIHLHLIGNKISELIPGTFENLNSLEYLGLSDNNLQHLDSAMFSGLINLKRILLSVNKLQFIHPDTFLGSPNLRRLYLRSNPTLQIPTDHNFINSLSLSHLDISECNISSLSVETFSNVSVLEWLDLRDNNLRTVDINILKALPKLSTLFLYGNPLQCDCQLKEVWRWCEDRNIQTADRDIAPECDTPSEVKGLWWGVLEKGQC